VEYDVIIIGAGASGLTAAIAAARQGSSVLVIEQKDRAGKKILATGNGKCNFTNRLQTPGCYRSDDSAFAMKVLSHFDVTKTLAFFEELGIYPKERDGYYYPNSEQATSVVSVLLMECERLKVQIHCNETVVKIERAELKSGGRSPGFMVWTRGTTLQAADKSNTDKGNTDKGNVNRSNTDRSNPDGKNIDRSNLNRSTINKNIVGEGNSPKDYRARNLILAAGGCASPKLGSDGSGYQLAKALGHTIIKPLPALVQLKSPEKYCKTVSGVRLIAHVGAYCGSHLLAEEEGEILFSDYGISGIPVLQLSRFVSKALDKGEQVRLRLDLLPGVSKVGLKELLNCRIRQNPAKTAEEMMIGLLNHKLSYAMIKESGLDPYKRADLLTDRETSQLVTNIKEFPMRIHGTNSFENAQVCAGGVSTKEICEETMESRLNKGLYLAGELVDVDGTCGGYNLQWAWSSGYLAGTSAGKEGRNRKHI